MNVARQRWKIWSGKPKPICTIFLQSFGCLGTRGGYVLQNDIGASCLGYIDTSRHPHVQGLNDNSMNNPEIQKCKDLFFNAPTIQERSLRKSPELAALRQLYQVTEEYKSTGSS